MQIIDGFDKDHLKVTVILKRNTMSWDVSDEYAENYLKCIKSHMEAVCNMETVTVYDIYRKLEIKNPKGILALLGWDPTDIFEMNYYVHENRIMISFICHQL